MAPAPTASARSSSARPTSSTEDDVVAALREPQTLTNINDSGAHLQLFCGAGQNVHLLTHYVRDTGQLLGIEEAVHSSPAAPRRSSASPTEVWSRPGAIGDLAVFALDEIELRQEERVYDVPYGSWRFTRPPAGFRATVVRRHAHLARRVRHRRGPGGFLRPG